MVGMLRRHRRSVPREGPTGPAPPRIGSAVARFVLGSLVAIVVVAVGGYIALRDIATTEAEDTTAQIVEVNGRLVQTALKDGILKRDPKAIAALDDFVVSQVLPPSPVKNSAPIKRVKIWAADGTVLYSDVRELIGQKYKLGDEEQELLAEGGADAEISDLSKPENKFERQYGKLLEAHTPIRTPNGTPVLFETYQQFSSIQSRAANLLRELAIPLLAGLAVLLLSQVPLAWSMAKRLQRGHRDRETLLANAIEASAQERRRIASDLHDGVVQDVAGVAFGLAPLAEDADRRGDERASGALRASMSTLRQGVRDLRTLLVEIHPPSLESAGIEAALSDLLSPLQADGIAVELHVDDRATAGSNGDALVYRVAREALRNTQKYAEADNVRIEVTRPEPDVTRLVVADDGKGFSADDRARRAEEGHVGLTLLESLVRQSNGTLNVTSDPGAGTTVELEVPVR
jgi:two-component system, NarL family, sensor kinase